jgi:oxygen-independent coproporphyrinogen-3 oxidase
LSARYVRAFASEIEGFDAPLARRDVDTIYFGGGTPSLLLPEQVSFILNAVKKCFHVAENAEVTLEIDPGTASPDVLREFRRTGINRASLARRLLMTMNYAAWDAHTAADVRRTMTDLRDAGFDNVSLDLIAGLPSQTLSAWQRNIHQALALRPEHLSLYLLEIHEGTPLHAQIKRGAAAQPDDAAAEMYRLMVEESLRAGYEHYEISNFCLPGHAARHNTKYWTGAPVYGFGCSAHSYDGTSRRWSNERSTTRYIELIESKRSVVAEVIELAGEEQRAEAIFLGLRLQQESIFANIRRVTAWTCASNTATNSRGSPMPD